MNCKAFKKFRSNRIGNIELISEKEVLKKK